VKRDNRWDVIREAELTATVLNSRQYEIGQCIVLPKRHAPTIFELTDAELAAVMASAREMAAMMMEVFDPSGILLYQNNGIGSGQEVPHFHLHVVPRQPGSDWGLGPPHISRLEQRPQKLDHSVVTEEKRQTADRIRCYWTTV
jgi:diadenosine tetraphosphate (Ap4A) HIT family hydrolase